MPRLLPIDYAIRNLSRRRMRTLITGLSSALVAALFVATTAFVRGLDGTFAGAAQDDTAILLSSVSERDVIRSTVSAGLPEILAASVSGIRTIGGQPAISGEIHMGTTLRLGPAPGSAPAPAPESAPSSAGSADPAATAAASPFGTSTNAHASDASSASSAAAASTEATYNAFLRGVTERAFVVHGNVTLTEGRPAHSGEVIVGALVAKQLGVPEESLALGRKLRFEGGEFEIVGRFRAPGSTTEAEIWAPLSELRGLVKRDDSSVVFVRMDSPDDFADLELFAKRRLDLELMMIPSAAYYRELVDYLRPLQLLAWGMAALIGAAALFSGANTLNAAVQDRVRELATLRALGYGGLALSVSLLTEALVLAAGGGLFGLVLARLFLAGNAVRIAMSAFELRVDAVGILVAFGGVLVIGILGAAPAAARVLSLSVAAALKEN